MRKLLASAILVAATSGVARAAVLSELVQAGSVVNGKVGIAYYVATDTTNGTGDVTDNGVASLQLDLVSSTGGLSPSAGVVFAKPVTSGDFNKQGAVLEAGNLAGYSSTNKSSIGTDFYLTYSDAVNDSQASGSAPYPDFSVGTPQESSINSGSVTPVTGGGSFPVTKTINGTLYSLVGTQVWNATATDTLTLYTPKGAAAYFNSADTAHQGVTVFANDTNSAVTGGSVTVNIAAANASVSVATTPVGTNVGSVTLTGSNGSYNAGFTGKGLAATSGNVTINGLGSEAGQVLALLEFTSAATPSDISALVSQLQSETGVISVTSGTIPGFASGLANDPAADDVLVTLSKPGPSPLYLNFSGLSSVGSGSLVLDAVAVVPEPTVLGLIGLAGLAALGRRRRNA